MKCKGMRSSTNKIFARNIVNEVKSNECSVIKSNNKFNEIDVYNAEIIFENLEYKIDLLMEMLK